MTNKPRIAFCFSGQARTLDQTYLFFQKNLFDAAKEQGFDYDVFCAVEDDEDVGKVELLNPTKVEKIKSSEVAKIIEDKYGDFIKTAFKTKYKWVLYTYDHVARYLQQIYKVSRSIKLCKIYNYDIVMKLRFDEIFINKFNFLKIKFKVKNGNNIICNDTHRRNFYEWACRSTAKIQDFYFVGNHESCSFLGDIFDNFEQCFLGHEVQPKFLPIYRLSNLFVKFYYYVEKNTIFHIPVLPVEFGAYTIFIPEKCYYEYFLYNKLNVIKTNISILILRRNTKDSICELNNKTEYEF